MGSGFFQQVQTYHFVETFGGLFTALFVMWRLGGLFSFFGSFNGAEFWHGIWKTVAWYGVVVSVAQFGGFDWFWSGFVEPLANTFAFLGQSVMSMGGYGEQCPQLGGYLAGASVSDAERNLLCFVFQMHSVIGAGIVYSINDIALAFNSTFWWTAPLTIIAGLLLLVAFLALWVLFILSFAEVVFRLVAPSVLFPMALIAFIFPVSRSFFRSAVGMLLHAFFYLLMMGIIFALGAQMMIYALKQVPGAPPFNVGSIIQFFSVQTAAVKTVGLADSAFWIMMLVAILTAMLLRQASSIASALVQYSDGLSGTSGHGLGVLAAAMRLGGTTAVVAGGPLGAMATGAAQSVRGFVSTFKPQSGGGEGGGGPGVG